MTSRPLQTPSVRGLLTDTARPYRLSLALGVLAGTGNLGAQLAIPWILRYLIDDVLGKGKAEGLLPAIGLVIAAALVATGFTTLGRWAYARLSAETSIALRDTLARHLRRLSLGEVQRHRSGGIMALFTSDVPVVAEFYESVVGQSIVNVFRFVVTLGVLVALFHGLALAALLLLPVYSLLPVLFNRRLRRAGQVLQSRKAELSADVQDSVAATREIKALDREGWDTARLHGSFARLLRPHLRLALFEALSSSTFVLFWISAGVIYWIGGREVLAGTMTLGELLAAISYFTYLDIPVSAFAGFNARWQTARAAAERLVAFLGLPMETPDRPGARPLTVRGGEVVFENIDFGYETDTAVLRGVSLRIEPGRRVALVGRSGAGKTTLVNLLLRLWEPTGGRVLIDGQDLREVTAASLRAAVGVVFQDSYLFPGMVEANIRFGDADATREQVETAARAAHADAFIEALPRGYETEVGERGVALSAGQKQRLAIARALLRDPRVLILDEATSNLDSVSEEAVQQGLDAAMRGRTILLIAHRLSTVVSAESVVVLEDGRIQAVGSHRELLRTSEAYHRLYAAQQAL